MKRDFSENILSTLLNDPYFFQWLIEPDPESDAYWKKRMDEDEQLKESVETLLETINRLKVVEPTPAPAEKELLRARIEQDIRLDEKKNRRNWKPLWAVAASITLLFGVYYLAVKYFPKTEEIDYSAFVTQEEGDMKSENISLVLSGNKSIQIEKDSAHIAYTSEGTIKIGEEEVAKESDGPQLNQLIVPYGKTTSLVLSDGTKVYMNSGSKLVYPSSFQENKREVFLTGEAFLDVTSNENAPFIVKTNHLDVHVLGTQLNVTAYGDDARQSVVLVSGKVEINNKNTKAKTRISPHEMLAYTTTNQETNVGKVDVNYYISWIYGYLLLNRERLPGLLQKLERHYNVSFDYNANELRKFSVSGKLDLNAGITEVLNFIALTAPVTYEIQEEQIMIKLRK